MADERMEVDLNCTGRGCGGEIIVSDNNEIYDGAEGRCYCGRVYVATAFTNGTMKMVYDKSRTDRERRKKSRV